MKVYCPCMQCILESNGKRHSASYLIPRNDGCYFVKCEAGHEQTFVLQDEKFQVLFEMGVDSFINELYRETVFNIASALERFHEFCTKVFLTKDNVSEQQQTDTWRLVASQSERQYGAFCYTYLLTFYEVPPKVANKNIEFRNDVIHKGLIPEKSQVIDYSQEMLEYMNKILTLMQTRCADAVNSVMMNRVFAAQKELSSRGIRVGCMTQWASLKVFPDAPAPSFINCVDQRKEKNELLPVFFPGEL